VAIAEHRLVDGGEWITPINGDASEALIQDRSEGNKKYEKAADQDLFVFVAHGTTPDLLPRVYFIPRAGDESIAVGADYLSETTLHPLLSRPIAVLSFAGLRTAYFVSFHRLHCRAQA
jgi:hypothetical protein